MAITFANSDTNSSKTAGTTLASFGSVSLTTGDLVVVAFASDDAAGSYSCADTVNTYVQDVTQLVNASHVRLTIFRTIATTTASLTITVTHPSLTARAIIVMTFSGTASSSPLDVTAAGATGTSTTPTSGSVTPSAANYVVIGAAGVEGTNANVATQDGNFTSLPVTQQGTTGGGAATNIYVVVGYNIQTTATARNYSPTITSASWADTALVYKVLAATAQVPYLPITPAFLAQ